MCHLGEEQQIIIPHMGRAVYLGIHIGGGSEEGNIQAMAFREPAVFTLDGFHTLLIADRDAAHYAPVKERAESRRPNVGTGGGKRLGDIHHIGFCDTDIQRAGFVHSGYTSVQAGGRGKVGVNSYNALILRKYLHRSGNDIRTLNILAKLVLRKLCFVITNLLAARRGAANLCRHCAGRHSLECAAFGEVQRKVHCPGKSCKFRLAGFTVKRVIIGDKRSLSIRTAVFLRSNFLLGKRRGNRDLMTVDRGGETAETLGRIADDRAGAAIAFILKLCKCIENRLIFRRVGDNYPETEALKFCGNIGRNNHFGNIVELAVILVNNDAVVVQTLVCGIHQSFPDAAFLHFAVSKHRIHIVLRVLLANHGKTDRSAYALAERTGRNLDARKDGAGMPV